MKIVFIPVMPRFSFTKWVSMRSKLYGCVSVMYGYTETFYLRLSKSGVFRQSRQLFKCPISVIVGRINIGNILMKKIASII